MRAGSVGVFLVARDRVAAELKSSPSALKGRPYKGKGEEGLKLR
jgi:hypothetical protein